MQLATLSVKGLLKLLNFIFFSLLKTRQIEVKNRNLLWSCRLVCGAEGLNAVFCLDAKIGALKISNRLDDRFVSK